MAYIDIIRNAKLLEKSIMRLETMGEARPKTVVKLKHALQPIADKPLVSIAEPFNVLHELQKVYGDVKVNIQYSVEHKLDISKMAKSVRSKVADKAQNSNSILVPQPTSDGENELTSYLKAWIDDILMRIKKKMLYRTAEEFERQFMRQYINMQENSVRDVAVDIIDNLKEVGYITTSSDFPADDDKVSFNFPSCFTLVCMKWILNTFQKHAGSKSNRKHLSTVIRTINRHVMKLQKALNGEIDIQMEKDLEDDQITCAVDSFTKAKQGTRRSGWERMPSRSRSRSGSSAYSRSMDSDEWTTPRPTSRSPSPTRLSFRRPRDKMKGDLTTTQKQSIVDGLIGKVQGLAIDTAAFLQNSLATLCQGMEKITVDDVRVIPHNLALESIYALLEIGKMGDSRPKTVKALKNAIKPVCRIYYLIDFSNLFTYEAKGNENMPRKRRHQMIPKKTQRGNHISLGHELKVKQLSINPSTLFLPDIKRLTNTGKKRQRPQQSRLIDPMVIKKNIMEEYMKECSKFVEFLTKHSQKQAQHWSSCVVLGDKLQESAAAGDIYRWLCCDERSMQCDGENVVKLRTFKNKDQLLKGLAERCVMCKNKVTVEQLVKRLEADGFIHVTDGAAIVYPVEENAKCLYGKAKEKYTSIVSNSMHNYIPVAETEAETLIKNVTQAPERVNADSQKKVKERGRVAYRGVRGGKGRGLFHGRKRLRLN